MHFPLIFLDFVQWSILGLLKDLFLKLVKKLLMEMESSISLGGTKFYSLSLRKNTSLGKDTIMKNHVDLVNHCLLTNRSQLVKFIIYL